MKVLLINNFFCPPGGVEAVMYSEAKLLKEKGFEVYFFATNKQPFFENNYQYRNVFPEFMDYKKLKGINLIKYFKIFYNLEAEKKLNILIKQIQPDIIHIHNVEYYLTYSVMQACEKYNIPILKTYHDIRFFCPGGTLKLHDQFCANDSCYRGNKFNCVLNKCKNGKFIDSLFVYMENLVYRSLNIEDKIAFFIFPSQAMLDLAVKFGIKKYKCIVINNFVDDLFFNNPPDYDNKGYFLYVGRLSPEKGIHYLLEAMVSLPKEIKLHIVGSGSEENRLKKMAGELNLNNVEFKGLKYADELLEEYHNCIATILPCNCFETFGVTIIESFACGKPVIASRVGAIPEIISDGEDGFLIEPGNIEELRGKIETFFYNNQMVITMGQKARKKAENNYNSADHIVKIIDLYNSLKILK